MSKYVLNQLNETSEEGLARQAFKPGMYLYGYCCGYFGRDSYGKKLIQTINKNRIVVIENGAINSCDTDEDHFSWIALLEASNTSLEEHGEYYREED